VARRVRTRASANTTAARRPRAPHAAGQRGIRRLRAAVAGCSRFAAYRAFRGRYGLWPSEYQRQTRLRNARRALAGGAAIADVAAEAGFADQAHLTRWFRRCYGITPGAYRAAASPR
jgi:AraC-like DNA-binding protein